MVDQFRGCLLGLGVGDALGAPLEGLSAAQIARRYGRLTEMQPDPRRGLRAGQTTDDTAMMLAILDSYNELAQFDPHDIAERFLDWYRRGPTGIGSLTREACENLLYGYNFERSGRDAWEAFPDSMRMGNGSLMRCAPTGLLRYHDHIHLVGESRVISGITHYDERCKLACVCLNLAIAHLLLVGIDGLLDELREFIEPRNTVLGYALNGIPAMRVDELRTSGYVVDTLQTALWAVLYCTEFEEGLTLVVNRGQDADTAGAVAGALLGARFGADAIPRRWLDTLEGRQRIDTGARRLYELSQSDGA
jgi:ADP-ribosyl-[dinitrogen reductase] hydrolase